MSRLELKGALPPVFDSKVQEANVNATSLKIQTLIDNHRVSGFQVGIVIMYFLIATLDGRDMGAIGSLAPSIAKDWALGEFPDTGHISNDLHLVALTNDRTEAPPDGLDVGLHGVNAPELLLHADQIGREPSLILNPGRDRLGCS
jgi:hypothetical protein